MRRFTLRGLVIALVVALTAVSLAGCEEGQGSAASGGRPPAVTQASTTPAPTTYTFPADCDGGKFLGSATYLQTKFVTTSVDGANEHHIITDAKTNSVIIGDVKEGLAGQLKVTVWVDDKEIVSGEPVGHNRVIPLPERGVGRYAIKVEDVHGNSCRATGYTNSSTDAK